MYKQKTNKTKKMLKQCNMKQNVYKKKPLSSFCVSHLLLVMGTYPLVLVNIYIPSPQGSTHYEKGDGRL